MPHAVNDRDRAGLEARCRASAQADADLNGEAMYLILRPEEGPRTATGSVRGGGPYWTAEGVAEPWERAQGERIGPTPPAAPCPEGRAAIMAEICAERARQDELFGGPAHDDRHSLEQWIVNLACHLGMASWDGTPEDVCFMTQATRKYDPVRYRRELVRVAAVAVAALEAFDRRAAALEKGGDGG